MTGSNFSKLMYDIAREEGISLDAWSDEWAFRFTKGSEKAYIVSHHFPLNPASSEEICRDKSLTSDILKDAGIPVSEHLFLPNNALSSYAMMPSSLEICRAALASQGKIVLKDNYGTGGLKVFLVSGEEELQNAADEIFRVSAAMALSPYYHIREEYRTVMLDGEPRLFIRKERAHEILDGEVHFLNWKHNLGQGATGIPVSDPEVTDRLRELAGRTVRELNLRFASVDIIDAEEGFMVLEVNAGVMLEHFSGQNEECYNTAKEIYRKAVLSSFRKDG